MHFAGLGGRRKKVFFLILSEGEDVHTWQHTNALIS